MLRGHPGPRRRPSPALRALPLGHRQRRGRSSRRRLLLRSFPQGSRCVLGFISSLQIRDRRCRGENGFSHWRLIKALSLGRCIVSGRLAK